MKSEVATRTIPGTVMASIDGTCNRSELIIADVTCDDAWLSMPEDAAPSLALWR